MIIPFNIASGTYTLKLFNEHINGDFKTDYASAFADVTLSVNSAIGKNGEDGVTPYVGENGTGGWGRRTPASERRRGPLRRR